MSNDSFKLPAFAKINLSLRVLGRRTDGFHEIRTIFQTISLRDSLAFEPIESDRIEFSCEAADSLADSARAPNDESNLVYKAAQALRERYGLSLGAKIRLEKRIPAQAGLGGGSSDAAAALLGLSHLWKLKTSKSDLYELGARIGSDVPFFFYGGTALGTGTGTKIEPLEDFPKKPLLVVVPGVGVSTAEAYKALNVSALTKVGRAANLSVSRAKAQKEDHLHELMRNDFEAVVMVSRPEIGRARDSLLRAGAREAMLSGSGSSVFGVFDDNEKADRACADLRTNESWRVFSCETLTRAEYFDALGPSRASFLKIGLDG